MIDTELLAEFERQYATVLDVLDGLKKIQPPVGLDKLPPDLARWFREVREVFATMPSMPDPDKLTRFAEDVETELTRIENKADAAQMMATKEDDEGVLGSEIPDGTEANQVLVWNNTDKVWEAGRVKAY